MHEKPDVGLDRTDRQWLIRPLPRRRTQGRDPGRSTIAGDLNRGAARGRGTVLTGWVRTNRAGVSPDELTRPQFGQKVSSAIELGQLDLDGTAVARCVGVRARAGRGAQQVAKLSCPRIGPIVGPA